MVKDINNLTAEEIANLSDEEIMMIELGDKYQYTPNPCPPVVPIPAVNLQSKSDEFNQLLYNSKNLQTVDNISISDPMNVSYEKAHTMTEEEIIAMELGNKTFMRKLQAVEKGRDYSIIIDASSSMFSGEWEAREIDNYADSNGNCDRWKGAKTAVEFLAPLACKCDADGITLYFFSDGFIKYPNIQSSEHVELLFGLEENQFQGGTDLAKVLQDALNPDNLNSFGERSKPESILIITDGAPDDPDAVEEILIKATLNTYLMKKADDICISIVQIGDDIMATSWLEGLSDRLMAKGARYNIVDVLPCKDFLAAAILKIFPHE
mmetsp:Transcript_30305/g.41704  ORF Transcript_30305/g.41704 Transcript_30305/m.41704 type:complete len:322 (+) Transcript_30305:30-995(+)